MGPRRRERGPANGAGARPVVAARKGTEIDQGEPAEREQTEVRRQQTCLPGEMGFTSRAYSGWHKGPMLDWATERRPIITERTFWPAPSRHLLCFGSLTGDRLVNCVGVANWRPVAGMGAGDRSPLLLLLVHKLYTQLICTIFYF
jgi:hypothetical protein